MEHGGQQVLEQCVMHEFTQARIAVFQDAVPECDGISQVKVIVGGHPQVVEPLMTEAQLQKHRPKAPDICQGPTVLRPRDNLRGKEARGAAEVPQDLGFGVLNVEAYAEVEVTELRLPDHHLAAFAVLRGLTITVAATATAAAATSTALIAATTTAAVAV